MFGKVVEKIIFNQLKGILEQVLLESQCGLRLGYDFYIAIYLG